MRYGRSSDRLFEMFTRAKVDQDVDQAKEVLDILDGLSYEDQQNMSELRADVDDFINDMDPDYELA